MRQLAAQGGRYAAIDAIVGWPGGRQMKGAEQPVEQGQGRCVITIDVFATVVVPVVKMRRGDQVFERAQTQAQIGVDQEAPGRANDDQQRRGA